MKMRTANRVWQGDRLADDHVVAANAHARRADAVVVQLVVEGVAHAAHAVPVRLLDHLLVVVVHVALLVAIRAEEDGAEQAAVDARRAHDDRVLLVVARVGQDGDDGVDAGGQVVEAHVLHGARGRQRLLRVVEHVRQCVHAHVEVGRVHAHRLLAHRRLQQRG